MPSTPSDGPVLSSFLATPLTVGEPDVTAALAVFPVLGADPRQPYVSFAQGRRAGVGITELEGGASVRDLLVSNPTSEPVLLYEGEEVLGAQQDRTFDVTVLVGADTKVTVPVSCVEAGRWESSRHDEAFTPAPHVPHPGLRRAKQRQAREQVALGYGARASQSEVWREVDRKAASLEVASPTRSLRDVFAARGDALDEARAAIRPRDGQIGAIAAIGGRISVLDHVSRPEVFAALHGPLLEGYFLDALEVDAGLPAEAPSLDDACGFLALVTGTSARERASLGLGRSLDFAADGVAGTALAAGDELVALTAFPEEDGSAPDGSARSGRIRRPSRRVRRQG